MEFIFYSKFKVYTDNMQDCSNEFHFFFIIIMFMLGLFKKRKKINIEQRDGDCSFHCSTFETTLCVANDH